VAKKASEAQDPSKQDPSSEAKAQDKGSENGGGKAQELDLAKIRESLLSDESFLEQVYGNESIQRKFQSERDAHAERIAMPLRQKIEELERNMAAGRVDPVALEVERLKAEGDFEGALRVAEDHARLTSREAQAEERGRQAAGQEMIQRIAAREEFSSLTEDDWRQVYADAATEATRKGQTYITVDAYVARAARIVADKEKGMVMAQSGEELDKLVEEKVEAQLKAHGLERRKVAGGPEEIAGGGGGAGGSITDDEAANMSQDEWNALPDEDRRGILQRASKMAVGQKEE